MIYVASSWRNPHYPGVLGALEQWALPYYDWRDAEGFHWSEIMPDTAHVEHWTDPIEQHVFMNALKTERAKQGFERDMQHLRDATAVILLLPCGKSAHLEAGWAAGAGKPLCIYLPEPTQPELMYGMGDVVLSDISAVMSWADFAHRFPKNPIARSATVAIAQEDIGVGDTIAFDLRTGKAVRA